MNVTIVRKATQTYNRAIRQGAINRVYLTRRTGNSIEY